MKTQRFLLILLALASAGCGHTVTQTELSDRIATTYQQSFISDLYYVGSTDRYDYFHEQNQLYNRSYRVARGEVSIPTPIPRTHETSRWRKCFVEMNRQGKSIGTIRVPGPED